jgi:two-component system phosphate regulon sensor histidine kinase PhoR
MPELLRHVWTRSLLALSAWLLAAVLLGLWIGRPWMTLALAALGALAWQSWRLHRVLRGLTVRRRHSPAAGRGAWAELDRLLDRSRHDSRRRKHRLVAMLRAYRAVAEALPDAVVVFERNSQRVQWLNAAAGRLLGLHHPADLGSVLGKRIAAMGIGDWLRAGAEAEPLMDHASPLDSTLRLNLRLIPYSADHWLLIARDVSKLMHLEHVRRDFVANVSHELRTPLTVIHGYLEMLEPAEHPDWAPMLAEMGRQSQRMAQLVEDLLTLSRLEAHERLDDERVQMGPMLSTLKREAEALSQRRHRIEIEDAATFDLLGSVKELHSAFSNLVGNAVRYTPAGGSIRIRFAADGDGVALAVSDTGYGIPAAHLPRITERFYRVSTSRSRELGGTGLGLAIAKHVLNLHQARLGIESEVGRGSVFSCHFGPERLLPRETAAAIAPTLATS